MKIAIIGGHMAPALGLIAILPKEAAVVYVGREHVFEGDEGESLEQKTITKKGIRFIPFHSGRMQRSLTSHTASSLLKIPEGFVQAFTLLKKEKPDVVVGFGGYLSVPLGVASKVLGIPLIIHESTLGAGLANKILIPFAQKICISWDSSRQYFPKNKTILTGNPMLAFTSKAKDIPYPISSEQLPLLVVSGGSGGSHAVNIAILSILPELLESYKILHVAGDAKEYGDFDKLVSKKNTLSKKLQDRYSLVKFVSPDYMNTVFAKADVVIGRSGINTVAALLVLRKKAILIPLLTGQKQEQYKNALLMESEGLATIINQHALSPKLLFQEITKVLAEKEEKSSKWLIPISKNGAENLMKEVMQCALAHHQEN